MRAYGVTEGSGDDPMPLNPGAVSARLPRDSARRVLDRFRPNPRAGREIILVLLMLFAYGFFQQQPAWNEYSRYDLVRALVEDGTTRIDRFQENTGDKAFYDGHYYSDKAPGTAILGVPYYVLLQFSSGTVSPDQVTAVQALAFGVSGISTALLVLLLFRYLRSIVGEGWALAVGLGFAFGSIAFPFATMFFGHAASSFFLFAAFYLLSRWRMDGGTWRPVAAGLLSGIAVLIEIPVVLGVAVLAVYVLRLGRGPTWRFIAGGIPVALVLMTYDWLTFGGPFTLGYQYATLFGEQNRQGIISIVWPSLATTGDLLFGPRGLIRLAPWFLFALPGVGALRQRPIRSEVVVCIAIVALFLFYNSGALNPFGGWTPGPRYLMPALPFAAILVALVPSVLRPLVASLMAVGAVVFFIATATMPNAPEIYRDPLWELWLPRLINGDVADTIAWSRWGLHGLQPLAVFAAAGALATIALAATWRPGSVAGRLAGALAFVLVVLIGAFAFPGAPPSPVYLAPDGSSVARSTVTVVEVGATPVITADQRKVDIWAQVENRGSALADTTVVFTALALNGREIWTASYGAIDWGPGERKNLTITWDAAAIPDGAYRVETRVESEGLASVYSSLDAPGLVRIRP
ncbi:MAG: hypothetical protein HYX54_09835 [Chloroflexi bacterium]|nr:hypothetical protein [Chloroflexota bacterium]